jgi:fatty acid desaturase
VSASAEMAAVETPRIFHEAPAADTQTPWARFWAPLLNDPRDVVFINLSLQMTLMLLPVAVALFVVGNFSWWWAPVYWAYMFAFFLDRFILMLHCTSHRPLFRKKYKFWNNYIPWVLGPLVGETPESYFVHHLGMHHREGNLMGDLSTTMPYRRDKITHWLRYWFRFMTVGPAEVFLYHVRSRRMKMVKRLTLGEGGFWLTCGLLAYFVSVQATLVVLVIPVIMARTLMIAGNGGQHAFVDPDEPDNDFKNSITCINSRYNRRCFNDGYHIIHHLKPSMHYTEMADEFDKSKELYGKQDAIVFSGHDFFSVWLLLMLGQKKRLAQAFVRLPGAPERTDEEVIALINRRMRPFDAEGRPLTEGA